MAGISILAFQLILSVHVHTSVLKDSAGVSSSTAPEEPILPFLRTPAPEWPQRRGRHGPPVCQEFAVADLTDPKQAEAT
jgi:hypothetical protein